MDNLHAILNTVEARGTMLRHEREILMSSHTPAWVICAEVLGEPFRSPGEITVTPAQLAEIRARIARQHEAELAANGLWRTMTQRLKAFRSYLRFLLA